MNNHKILITLGVLCIVVFSLISFCKKNIFYEDVTETITRQQACDMAIEKLSNLYKAHGFKDFTVEIDEPILDKEKWIINAYVIYSVTNQETGEQVQNRIINKVII